MLQPALWQRPAFWQQPAFSQHSGHCDIGPSAIPLWTPPLAGAVDKAVRTGVTWAIAGVSLFGIALGFADPNPAPGQWVQAALHSVAVLTGLIG